MKYCRYCGNELLDEAIICSKCGCKSQLFNNNDEVNNNNGITILIKVFLIISCILTGWIFIPLLWKIPMTVHYFNSIEDNKKVGLAYEILTLIFVSRIAGILLLVYDEH